MGPALSRAAAGPMPGRRGPSPPVADNERVRIPSFPVTPGGGELEVHHKPKPVHGWREFLVEIGVIVIGVLIALGAEQLVEHLTWDRRTEAATALLRKELVQHYFEASEAVVVQPCIDKQLALLELGLQGGSRTPAKLYSKEAGGTFTYRLPTRPWSQNIWTALVSEGVTSHLGKDLRDNLGDHYSQIAIMRDNNRATDQLSWRLNILSGPMTFDAATRAHLAEEIEEARGRQAYMALVGGQILARLQDMKFTFSPSERTSQLKGSGTVAFCQSHGLPLGPL